MSIQVELTERRATARIPVDSVLLYRAMGMDNFKPCHVLTVSTDALEIVSHRPIPMGTIITIAVKAEGLAKKFYRVHGEVVRREAMENGWLHIVAPPSHRPWLPMFLYDVMCSTYEPVRPEAPITRDGDTTEIASNIYDELERVGANLDAWESVLNSETQTAQVNTMN